MPVPGPTLKDRLQSGFVRGLAGLPDGVLRRLVGRPVTVDGQQLYPETQLGLKLLAMAGAPSLDELTPDLARLRVAADARAFEGAKVPLPEVRDLEVAGAAGNLPARLYVPNLADRDAALVVYFHGGGFVTGGLDTHDNSCRFLAQRSGARVLAIGYRLAPEHRFPEPFDDAIAAFRFASEHVRELGGDPERMGVAGDSAGGNLAAGVAQACRDGEGPAPAFQLLFYPWLDLAEKRESYRLFGEGFYLTDADLDWYRDHYVTRPGDAGDPRCSPLAAEELAGVAPAYVAVAGFDPLRDEGEEYARRLRAAGVPVAVRRHTGLIHGFFNTVSVGRAGREAVLEAVGALELGLGPLRG